MNKPLLLMCVAALMMVFGGCGAEKEQTAPAAKQKEGTAPAAKEAPKQKEQTIGPNEGEEKDGLFIHKKTNAPYTGKLTNRKSDGEVIEMRFKDGKQHGKLTVWHKNGKKSVEAHFKEGMPEVWEAWSGDGKTHYKDVFTNGTGTGLAFHDDATKKREMPYRNGKRHGTSTLWDENGKILSTSTYENGSNMKY